MDPVTAMRKVTKAGIVGAKQTNKQTNCAQEVFSSGPFLLWPEYLTSVED